MEPMQHNKQNAILFGRQTEHHQDPETDQNRYFKATCSCRGLLEVLVTLPPDAVSIAVPGGLKLAVFVRLKASNRNCKRDLSVVEKSLNRDISRKRSGPAWRIKRPELPYVKASGTVNAVLSNHKSGVGFASSPEPRRFGLSLLSPTLAGSVEIVG